MGKKYSEMNDDEKAKLKIRLDRYRLKNPEIYRKAAKDYYYKNKERQIATHKLWMANNKEYINTAQRDRKRRRKEDAILKFGSKCKHCDKSYHPAVYEFHHLDPSTKDRDPSKMFSLSQERIDIELNNCIMLCANCHRTLHHEASYK